MAERLEITKEDWFRELIDHLSGVLDKGIFNSRWALIEAYHEVGAQILIHKAKFGKMSEKRIASQVSQNIQIGIKGRVGERMIERSIQFARKYPDLDALPEGKNISLHKIFNTYLPQSEKKEVEPKCKHCPLHCK